MYPVVLQIQVPACRVLCLLVLLRDMQGFVCNKRVDEHKLYGSTLRAQYCSRYIHDSNLLVDTAQ